MSTVDELADALRAYSRATVGNGRKEVMLAYDGQLAFPILRGDDHSAMSLGGMENFLVLVPDTKGKKLDLKCREIANA